jgi:hypothetical protein
VLLDELMPDYHFRERHATDVNAPLETVERVVRSLRPDDLRLFTVFLALRNLPARLTGQRAPAWSSEQSVLDQLLTRGFVLLAEDPGHEIVVGTIGRFWTLNAWASEDTAPPFADAREFVDFSSPGYAKASANFRVERARSLTRLSTETRIQATDSAARSKFALYWALIRPGSALIRRDLLRSVRRRVERG